MKEITREEFDVMVEEAWEALPEVWKNELKDANISWQVMDLATSDISRRSNVNPWNLLGLFTGVPKPQRHVGFEPLAMPDLIYLFRLPILSMAASDDHLKKIIEHVLYHEIGHYFGLNEEELHRAQKDPF